MRTVAKIASAAIGIGAFGAAILVIGIMSPPAVELQFCGYRTNLFEQISGASTQQVSQVSALFSLTNGSGRVIASQAPSSRFRLRLASRSPEGWVERSRFLWSVDSDQRELDPFQAVNFSIFQTNFAETIRASVDFTSATTGDRPWHRLQRWIRGSLTNQCAFVVIEGI